MTTKRAEKSVLLAEQGNVHLTPFPCISIRQKLMIGIVLLLMGLMYRIESALPLDDVNAYFFSVNLSSFQPAKVFQVREDTPGPVVDLRVPKCPAVPPNLVGPLATYKGNITEDDVERNLSSYFKPGGFSHPADCFPNQSVAVIIPFRDRESHLGQFLANIHPVLRRQQLDYGIFIVEQTGPRDFNRAALMNVGYAEAIKLHNFTCFVFHDVDHLPEDDRNLYTCTDMPRHMSVTVDKYGYKLLYGDYFGGVSSMSRAAFEKVNGFSNSYWGWGGEDDDMTRRIKHHGMHIYRTPGNYSRYKTIEHKKEKESATRLTVLGSSKSRFATDGLNSLNYSLKEIQLRPLYTWLLVEL